VLETPVVGSQGIGHSVDITGWVVGRVDAASLQIRYRDTVLRVIPVDERDVAASERSPELPHDVAGRFSSAVDLIGLGTEVKLTLTVLLGDLTRVPVGYIRLRRRPVRTNFEPTLQPLIVSSLGRSGSSWLMRMLGAHPAILKCGEHPYEDTYAVYWLHVLRVLSGPTNRLQSSDHAFQENLWFIGQNPFSGGLMDPALRDWFSRSYVERLATFCQRTIEDWYRTVAWRQAEAAGTDAVPGFFAEKIGPSSPIHHNLVHELYPDAKEVVLIRDFRDMMSSILAYDKARGFSGFGRKEGWSDEDYIREMRLPALSLYEGWQSRSERAHLVRYEDLVLHPRETLTGVLDYLGISSSDAVIDAMLSAGTTPEQPRDPTTSWAQIHETSKDAVASIGRWRRDLDPALQACCQEAFGGLLEELGYPEG
jgi:hypothetical protein